MIEAKAFRTLLESTPYSSSNVKLTLHKALIRSVMPYACPAWELAAHIYLLKLQRQRNKVFRTTGNFPRCTPVRDLHTAQPSVCIRLYNKIMQATSRNMQNHENEHVRSIGQGEAGHRKYRRLKLGGGQGFDRSSD
jgi:hypothetical protein